MYRNDDNVSDINRTDTWIAPINPVMTVKQGSRDIDTFSPRMNLEPAHVRTYVGIAWFGIVTDRDFLSITLSIISDKHDRTTSRCRIRSIGSL